MIEILKKISLQCALHVSHYRHHYASVLISDCSGQGKHGDTTIIEQGSQIGSVIRLGLV